MKFENLATTDNGDYFFTFFDEKPYEAELYFYYLDDFFKEKSKIEDAYDRAIANKKNLLAFHRKEIEKMTIGQKKFFPIVFEDQGVTGFLLEILSSENIITHRAATPEHTMGYASMFYEKKLFFDAEKSYTVSKGYEMSKKEFLKAFDGLIASIDE